jgi:hypothetical protein
MFLRSRFCWHGNLRRGPGIYCPSPIWTIVYIFQACNFLDLLSIYTLKYFVCVYGADNSALQDVKQDLRELMSADEPYSKAAECYVRCFRDREWIEQLIFN